jgi:pimeloyl-ACP methyl ester carboxylesterase
VAASRHPARRLVPLVALAVLVGLVLAVGVDVVRSGGPRLWLARHGLPPPYVPQGERIDIGGRSLYLDCRGTGSPTVVLISGMGDGAGSWSAVLDELAATTRTCAYDRAGIGSSDPRGTHTVADAVADLRALLDAAGESGPFVVVGHSLGGTHARVFATDHRDETTGVVLVDTFDPDLQADAIEPLLGGLRGEYVAELDGLRDLVARVERLDWETSETQLRTSSVAGLPVEVLRAPRFERRLDDATNAEIAAAWQSAFEALSPGRVHYAIAPGAGHIIQIDRPDLVVEAVRRLVAAARG